MTKHDDEALKAWWDWNYASLELDDAFKAGYTAALAARDAEIAAERRAKYTYQGQNVGLVSENTALRAQVERLTARRNDLQAWNDEIKVGVELLKSEVATLRAQVERMRDVIEAARQMPRKTPIGGGASTVHMIGVEASVIWRLDDAFRQYDAATAKEPQS